jgi:hypothetical protein
VSSCCSAPTTPPAPTVPPTGNITSTITLGAGAAIFVIIGALLFIL